MTARPARSHVEARPHTSGLALSSLPVLLLPRMDIFSRIKLKGQEGILGWVKVKI